MILLDITMPEMDGFELCKRLKADPATVSIPVLFLSANDDKNTIVKGLEAGGIDYITKPFNKAELIARVRTHVALKRSLERADDLLHMIVPKSVGKRLKAGEQDIVDTHAEATIVFADIVRFTDIAERHDAVEVARWLGQLFSYTDVIASKHSIKKVKTVGGAYLAFAPSVGDNGDGVISTCAFALELLDTLSEGLGDKAFQLRIGIHSGPVVSGVVGLTQYCFGIWGASVSVAKRAEESERPGTACVTSATHDLLAKYAPGRFEFTEAGSLPHGNPSPIYELASRAVA